MCTSYLASLHDGKGYILSNNTNIRDSILLGDLLRIGLRKGLIILPKDPSVPIVCVGPGTGIAPMRALIEYRIHRGSNRMWLIFNRAELLNSCNLCTARKHSLLWLPPRIKGSAL